MEDVRIGRKTKTQIVKAAANVTEAEVLKADNLRTHITIFPHPVFQFYWCFDGNADNNESMQMSPDMQPVDFDVKDHGEIVRHSIRAISPEGSILISLLSTTLKEE